MTRARALSTAWLLGAAIAAAASPAAAQTIAVIEPGREEEVMALLAPHTLGQPVRGEIRLANVAIERTAIHARLEGPDGEMGSVVLAHPDAMPEPDQRTASFAVRIEGGGPGVRAAAETLADAIARNDPGGFWRRTAVERESEDLLTGTHALAAWITDGTLLSIVALALLLALVGRQLRSAPPRVAWLLLATVLVGLVYRLWLSPHTFLGAWPYSRTVPLVRRIWEGPALAHLSELLGPVAHVDLVTTVTLVFAAVTPLALFAHARALVGDAWTALAAAAVLAVLPAHVRFSHSEVEFIPSIALSSLTFALVHVATKDPAARWRWIATVGVPVLVVATLVTRPLNLLFLPLFVLAALAFRAERIPRWRAALVVTLILGTGAAAIWMHFLHHYTEQVREAAGLHLVVQVVESIFSLRWNTLIHPGITPPVMLLLAVLGAVWCWRSRRRLVAFLLVWLAAFFAAHAYVMPHQSAMQARYHLHLAVPFALLCALGLVTLARRRRRVAAVAIGLVAIAPLLHLDFVRDVAFNDLREHAFVREATEHIPEGCAVLEHTGPGTGDHDARFSRMGAVLDGHRERRRWPVYPIGAPPGGDPIRQAAREALEGPCVFYYEGIPCWSERAEGEPVAAACAAMREAVPLEPVLRTRFDSRIYDGNLAPGDDVSAIPLTLYRVIPREAIRPQRPRR